MHHITYIQPHTRATHTHGSSKVTSRAPPTPNRWTTRHSLVIHCNTLQHSATPRTTPAHKSPHCNTLQHMHTRATHLASVAPPPPRRTTRHSCATHYTAQHHTATHYTTMHPTATHYNALERHNFRSRNPPPKSRTTLGQLPAPFLGHGPPVITILSNNSGSNARKIDSSPCSCGNAACDMYECVTSDTCMRRATSVNQQCHTHG